MHTLVYADRLPVYSTQLLNMMEIELHMNTLGDSYHGPFEIVNNYPLSHSISISSNPGIHITSLR